MPTHPTMNTARYARVIDVSKRVRWEIERDVIRGRDFDLGLTFLPRGLSLADELEFLSEPEARLFSQVQGRTYANMFALVERFIAAKVIDLARARAFGDQVAMEALVRMTDEELKHQALFRRLEELMAATMPSGYAMTADPDAVADVVLAKSDWAVLALTLDIELFSQAHYRASIEPQHGLCPLWKDVFLFHWREESQHAVLDELEFLRENARLSEPQRDAAVDDLIALVGAVDATVQAQAVADATYFCAVAGRAFDFVQRQRIHATLLKAYRWQYIVSGALEPRFQKALFGCLNEAQQRKVQDALAPLVYAMPAKPDALPLAA
jgi:hypothetical protein